MNAFVLTMAGIIAIGAILDILMPDKNYKKYIRPLLGIIIVLTMAKPLLGGWDNGFAVAAQDGEKSQEYYEGVYQSNIRRVFEEKMGEDMMKFMKEKRFSPLLCTVTAGMDEKGGVLIENIRIVLPADESASLLAEAISSRYGIEKDKIQIENKSGL
jgi:hypothetical protein